MGCHETVSGKCNNTTKNQTHHFVGHDCTHLTFLITWDESCLRMTILSHLPNQCCLGRSHFVTWIDLDHLFYELIRFIGLTKSYLQFSLSLKAFSISVLSRSG